MDLPSAISSSALHDCIITTSITSRGPINLLLKWVLTQSELLAYNKFFLFVILSLFLPLFYDPSNIHTLTHKSQLEILGELKVLTLVALYFGWDVRKGVEFEEGTQNTHPDNGAGCWNILS